MISLKDIIYQKILKFIFINLLTFHVK